MKHSIRYIQVNYSASGKGKSIFILRGMEIRKYQHSLRRYAALLEAMGENFETLHTPYDYIAFSRVYPK